MPDNKIVPAYLHTAFNDFKKVIFELAEDTGLDYRPKECYFLKDDQATKDFYKGDFLLTELFSKGFNSVLQPCNNPGWNFHMLEESELGAVVLAHFSLFTHVIPLPPESLVVGLSPLDIESIANKCASLIDAKRIHGVMKYLNWTWVSCGGTVPSPPEITYNCYNYCKGFLQRGNGNLQNFASAICGFSIRSIPEDSSGPRLLFSFNITEGVLDETGWCWI